MKLTFFTHLSATLALILPGTICAQKKKYAESHDYLRAMEALQNKDVTAAEEWLEKEIANHSDNTQAYALMSIVSLNTGQRGKALSSVQSAIQHASKREKGYYAWLLQLRGQIHLELTDTLKGIEDLTASIKTDPLPKYYVNRGGVYFDMGKYDEAYSDFDSAIQLDPFYSNAYIGAGLSGLKLENWEFAENQFSLAIATDPKASMPYALRGEAYAGMEDWDRAGDDIIKALSIDRNVKALDILNKLKKEGREQIKPKLQYMTELQPDSTFWNYCLGALASSASEYEEALGHFNRCLDLGGNLPVFRLMAICEKNLRRYPEALTAVENAEKMNDPHSSLLTLKANLLMYLGRTEEAIKECDKIIKRSPDDPTSYLNRGVLWLSAGNAEKGLEDFTLAYALDSDGKQASYIALKTGDAQRLLGNQTLALEEYRKIVDKEKDVPLAPDSHLPFGYAGVGETEKAIATQKQIAEMDPENKNGHLYNLACIYARVGRPDEAVETLKQISEDGFDDIGLFKTDYDLDSLRGHTGFKELISNLEHKYNK